MPNLDFDKEKYYTSIRKLDSIFRDISETVNDTSKWRCPYKNVSDRCTAKFGCRNQDRNVKENELYVCTGSDSLNYSSAWETE